MDKRQERCWYMFNDTIEDYLKKYNLNNIKSTKTFHYADPTKNTLAYFTFDIEYDSQQLGKRHLITLICWLNKNGNIVGYGYDLHEKNTKLITNFNEKLDFEKYIIQVINHKDFIIKQQSS